MDTKYLKVAETAKLIRAALKKEFPAVKFSVRSRNGNVVDVEWLDGPTSKEVDEVAKDYEAGRFDSMVDYAFTVQHWLLPDGSAILARSEGSACTGGVYEAAANSMPHGAIKVSFGAKYVFTQRKVSAELMTKALCQACTIYVVSDDVYVTESEYDGSGMLSADPFIPQADSFLSSVIHRQLSRMGA